jgi:hypothetical protein
MFPPNQEIPKKLKKRLAYDEAEKRLVLKGNLSTREKDDLLKGSQDRPYQEAVNELYSGQLRREWVDPHTISAVSPGNPLAAPDASAKQWARVLAEALEGEKSGMQTSIVAFATVQNDKYLEATENMIPIALQSRPEQITRWVEDKLENRLRKIMRGARKRRKDDIRVATSAVASIRPSVEARVSASASELISGSPSAWEDAAREYTPMMAVVAKSLSPGVTSAALWRRRQIEYVKPDMRPKTAADEKAARKKRGNK